MSFTYKLYTGENVDDITLIESETLEASGTDVTTLSATNLNPGITYKANVLAIHDASGEKAIYTAIEVTILDPEILELTANPTSIEDDPTDANGDPTVVACSWDMDSNDTTTLQEEVTVTSLNTDIVTISNVDQVARTFDATLQIVDPGNPNETTIEIRSDFDIGKVSTISVTVKLYEEQNQYESTVSYSTA